MPNDSKTASLPRVAMVLGDPAGIGPELVAKLLDWNEATDHGDIFLVGDRDEVARGAEVAGVAVDVEEVDSFDTDDGDPPRGAGRIRLLHHELPDRPGFARAAATAEGGRYSLQTLEIALDLARSGRVDSICFAPLNKEAMHRAGIGFDDELHWFADRLGHDGYVCEFNVMKDLWSSRVTSHVALRDIFDLITEDRIMQSIRLIHGALRQSGLNRPRIAVAAINPHGGDGGAFGREEIDIIAPAVERAQQEQIDVSGPYPADTLFIKAFDGAFDGVVTMYHDQGQIALKVTGFEDGVTVQGGLPIPITTPAHGTAFDIVGQGSANLEPTRQAFLLACRMGRSRSEGAGAT